MIEGNLTPGEDGVPDLANRLRQQGAGRPECPHGLRYLNLDDAALGRPATAACRGLGPGPIDEGINRATRHLEADGRDAEPLQAENRKDVERAGTSKAVEAVEPGPAGWTTLPRGQSESVFVGSSRGRLSAHPTK